MIHDFLFWTYNLCTVLALPVTAGAGVAHLVRHPEHRAGAWQRLGFLPSRELRRVDGRPRIWMQAVSVGEVQVAAALTKALGMVLPEASFVVSSTTPDGFRQARATLAAPVRVIYYPFDYLPCVLGSLGRVRPDMFVSLETEIWPNFIRVARALGTVTVLANGRISHRSMRRYLRARPFFKWVLGSYDLACMIGGEDADRILRLGIPADRVRTTGNAKYDALADRIRQADPAAVASRMDLDPDAFLFVAGSIRGTEEPLLLGMVAALLDRPGTVVVVAPRHLTRTDALTERFRAHGLRAQRWSRIKRGQERRTERLVVLDTMGDLFDFYGAAHAVFCGASLAPLGGQNIMEPAAWGKTVLFGPHTEDFEEAARHLEVVGGGIRVKDARDLQHKVEWLMDHPAEREAGNRNARRGFESFTGAAQRTARAVAETWLKHEEQRFRLGP